MALRVATIVQLQQYFENHLLNIRNKEFICTGSWLQKLYSFKTGQSRPTFISNYGLSLICHYLHPTLLQMLDFRPGTTHSFDYNTLATENSPIISKNTHYCQKQQVDKSHWMYNQLRYICIVSFSLKWTFISITSGCCHDLANPSMTKR